MARKNRNYGNLDKEDADTLQFTKQSYLAAKERTNIGAYEYDAELSNEDTGVWHNPVTKQTHVSNRGSKTGYDWFVSDLQILTGTEKYGNRFKRAVKQTEAAHAKYGYDVTTSGHSLGGAASSYTTEKLGGEAWYKGGTGFNPGSSPFGRDGLFSKQRSDCNKATPETYCGKQSNVKIDGDPISMLTTGYGTTKNYSTKESMAFTAAKYASPGFALGAGLLNHTMGNFDARVSEEPEVPAQQQQQQYTARPLSASEAAEYTGDVQLAEVASDSEDEYAEDSAYFYKPAQVEETYNAAPPRHTYDEADTYDDDEADDEADDEPDTYDSSNPSEGSFWLNGVSADSRIIGHVPYNAKDESQYAYKLIYYN